MDLFVLSDLIGTVLAFVGGVSLAIPAFRDYGRRQIDKGLAIVMGALGGNPGQEHVASARKAIEREETRLLSEERGFLKIGIALLTVGLFLSIPVKVRDVVRSQPDPPASDTR